MNDFDENIIVGYKTNKKNSQIKKHLKPENLFQLRDFHLSCLFLFTTNIQMNI